MYVIAVGMSSHFFLLRVLRIGILVMSPHKKLQWFSNHGWTPDDIAKVTERVLNRWRESYVHLMTSHTSTSSTAAPPPLNVSQLI